VNAPQANRAPSREMTWSVALNRISALYRRDRQPFPGHPMGMRLKKSSLKQLEDRNKPLDLLQSCYKPVTSTHCDHRSSIDEERQHEARDACSLGDTESATGEARPKRPSALGDPPSPAGRRPEPCERCAPRSETLEPLPPQLSLDGL